METGTITAVKLDKFFGFIKVGNDKPDCFFHASELSADLEFDIRLKERRVKFDVIETDRGPRAANIMAAE